MANSAIRNDNLIGGGATGTASPFCIPMDINEFYHSRQWEHLRARILRRDGYQCRICRRYGRLRQATTVHHIKHLDEYPELALDPSNLVSVCTACHNELHPEKGGGRNGHSVYNDA